MVLGTWGMEEWFGIVLIVGIFGGSLWAAWADKTIQLKEWKEEARLRERTINTLTNDLKIQTEEVALLEERVEGLRNDLNQAESNYAASKRLERASDMEKADLRETIEKLQESLQIEAGDCDQMEEAYNKALADLRDAKAANETSIAREEQSEGRVRDLERLVKNLQEEREVLRDQRKALQTARLIDKNRMTRLENLINECAEFCRTLNHLIEENGDDGEEVEEADKPKVQPERV